jgi:molybdate transport system substrate-binding protein
MTEPLHVLSSMATKAVLAELAQAYEASSGERVVVESVGGLDAKKRVQAGETFDAVVLSVTVTGEALPGAPVLRSGARPGDRLVRQVRSSVRYRFALAARCRESAPLGMAVEFPLRRQGWRVGSRPIAIESTPGPTALLGWS